LEAEIERLEKQRDDIQHQFSDTSLSGEQIDKLSISLRDVQHTLSEKTARWFELSERQENS
jgi:ATP-binding cassette subfamily F protein uup